MIRILLLAIVVIGLAGGSASAQDVIHKPLPVKRLEAILTEMKIDYEKLRGPVAGSYLFNFENKKLRMSLIYFNNGTDLMMEASFKKASLDVVNKWNIETKFSRAVSYPAGNGFRDRTALEWNLDMEGGVTDAIIRQFINRFDDEATKFNKVVKQVREI